MLIKLEDADVDRIADAVVAKIAAAGGKVSGEAPPPKETKAPKKDPKKDTGPKREDVLAKVRELGAKDEASKKLAKSIIAEWAPAFGDVPDDKLGELLVKINAALEGGAPASTEDEF